MLYDELLDKIYPIDKKIKPIRRLYANCGHIDKIPVQLPVFSSKYRIEWIISVNPKYSDFQVLDYVPF